MAVFIHHLQSGFGAVLDASAGLKNELVVHVHARFAQGASIAFEAFLAPRGGQRPGEKRDSFVPQLEQMLGGCITARDIIAGDVHELRAERRSLAKQHGRNSPSGQLLINPRFGRHAINRGDE